LALAAAGDRPAALVEWAALPERATSARLHAVVAAAYQGQVRDALGAGRWADAVKVTDAAFDLAGSSADQPELAAAAVMARHRLASEAAGRGAWAEAIPYWQQMAALLESMPSLGPRGPILHNLAIAYETTEQWGSAAEMWVSLLNTLPRRQTKTKKTADALPGRMGSLSVTEKRAWLRRRALECYRKAGQLDQAITQYRAAIKTVPDDLDLRLELANALLANDQVIAGRNELRRIVERDPNHQEARIKLAELHQERGETWEAERLLHEVVAADPDNASARRGLVELLRQRGHGQFNAGYHAGARDTYAAALKLAPDDANLLASIGFAELVSNDEAAARGHFEAALAKGTADAYLEVLNRWASCGRPDEFRVVLARAETVGVVSLHFYVDAMGHCFRAARRPELDLFSLGSRKGPRAADPWEELGKTLLQKVEATGGDRPDVCQHMVAEFGPLRPDLALPYAEKMAALSPDDPTAWMTLAMILGLNNRQREAKETLRKAGQLARKRGDTQLISQIETFRRALDDPMFGMMSQLLPMLGDVGFEDLL
jgi:tetratricopeptide (TPR) repeat protein